MRFSTHLTTNALLLVVYSSNNIVSSRTFFRLYFQEYIKSLCNPELVISVPFGEQYYGVLYESRDKLEKSTGAVVKFPSRSSCSLQGSAEAVILAQSVIEEKLRTTQSAVKPTQSTVIEPQLREFALKLGYSNQVIDQAVQKLGTNVTQNTLLNELLKTTASLPYQISAAPSQPKPSAGPIASYSRPREVVARGAPSIPPAMLRYDNPSDQMVRSHWDRDPSPGPAQHYAMRDAIPKGAAVMPRPSYDVPGDLMERGVPRGTKRGYEPQRPADIIARGAPPVQPLMQVHAPPYGNHVAASYDVHRDVAGSSGLSASERLDEQEQLMYQQIVGAKKAAGSTSSNLRPVVIDGSNVAMRWVDFL